MYVASLKSYEGMGEYTARVTDHNTKKTFEQQVDGIWAAQISVPEDIPLTPPNVDARCTGNCTITILTHPMKPGRSGNKVKIMTVSARTCRLGESRDFAAFKT